jgi:ABC transport system ATP-binding/permease protein
LLRLLAGGIEPSAGEVRTGKTVRLGVLTQELAELDGTQRVLESLEAIRRRAALGDGQELTASQLAERFGFAGNRQWAFVGDLSGGERRRLQLMRLMLQEPNVLLLDEPTNDLDIDTLTALEDLLDGWPGTLVVVSHDRYLTERVCDRAVALLGDGRITDLPGGIEEYLRRRAALEGSTEGHLRSSRSSEGAPRSEPAADTGRSEAERRAARKEVARIERRLERIATEETKLHEKLAAASTEPDRLLALDADLRALITEREQLEEAWLENAVD